MGYASLPWRSEVDGQVYRFCDDDLADAEYEAELYKELTLRHWTTVREIADMALAVLKEEEVGEGRPLEELRRRMAEMERDADLLALNLPLAELIEIIARADENFSWLIANDPNPARAARAERDQVEWRARMIPLLDRLGARPKGVLRRRKKLA